MACSAAVACAETPSHSRGPGNIRVRVSFTTGAVRSAILATAGLLVIIVQKLVGIDAAVLLIGRPKFEHVAHVA